MQTDIEVVEENDFGKSINFFQKNKDASSLKIWLTKDNKDSKAVSEIQDMLCGLGISPEVIELFDDPDQSPEVRTLIKVQYGEENPVLTCGNTILGDMETLKSMSSEELKKLVGNDQGVSEGQESTTTLPTIGFAHQIVDGFKKVTSMVNPLSYFGAAPPTYDFPSKDGKWGEEFDVICENYYGRKYLRKLYFSESVFVRGDTDRVIKDQMPYGRVKKLEVAREFLVLHYDSNPNHPTDKVYATAAHLQRIKEILTDRVQPLEIVQL